MPAFVKMTVKLQWVLVSAGLTFRINYRKYLKQIGEKENKNNNKIKHVQKSVGVWIFHILAGNTYTEFTGSTC